MVAIRLLPPEVVNRIAAGEVIERPASVVKELVENSIDAGASRISVELEDGGKKLIRIRDDGKGISLEDLPLAFTSHATSKIDVDLLSSRTSPQPESENPARGLDLLNVATLGFRGEALASIGSIAQVEVLTRTSENDCAYRYLPQEADQDQQEPEPASGPRGTTIEVRNIFYKTPARRKFLKASSTEQSHINEVMTRIALGNPQVGFKVKSGSRLTLDLPAREKLRDRIADLIGEERGNDLISVQAVTSGPGGQALEQGQLWLKGYVCHPRQFRSDTKGQNFFINGRWIKDRSLSHALKESFSGFQIPGRHAFAYIYLDLEPGQVDINVHPQKFEVRFQEPKAIYVGLKQAIREALKGVGERPPSLEDKPRFNFSTGSSSKGGSSVDQQERQLDSFALPSKSSSYDAPRGSGSGGGAFSRSSSGSSRTDDLDLPPPSSRMSFRTQEELTYSSSSEEESAPQQLEWSQSENPLNQNVVTQVLNSFLLTEDGEDLLLIDQHALHEKILYEKIIRAFREGEFTAQRLLLPEVIRLSEEEYPFLQDVLVQLRAFGFEVDPFGEKEIAIQAVPVLLDRAPLSQLIPEIIEAIREHPAGAEVGIEEIVDDRVRQISSLMACKQAVKAGMKLSDSEIKDLIKDSQLADEPGFCPHGRRATVRLSRNELDHFFDRK